VKRGEGEVTQWPRGLTGYVPKGPPDATPSPDEDRTENRLLLAARLLAVVRSSGENVDEEVRDLSAAESAHRRGDVREAALRLDRVLASLDARRARAAPGRDTDTP